MQLFAELKRRNVIRVGAAYLALGWIVTQVTTTVGPVLNLPAVVNSIVVWIGLIGFPFVIVFAWIYELTPEGLKRESEVDRTASITQLTSRRLDYLIVGMLAAAILLYFVDPLRASRERAEAPAVASGDPAAVGSNSTSAPAVTQVPAVVQGPIPLPVVAPDDKSVAVLPFVNMSEDKGNEFFADGVAEELLNLLAKIPELRVIARTSSFAFKGKDVDIAEIAQKLGVAHVLEGSVRKAGNKVRITAQLIRAADRTHLWSETYDRSLDDIFAVQDEIAGKVVEQLKVTLLGSSPKSVQANTVAYTLCLQAEHLSNLLTADALAKAVELFEQALALDPAYARAWSGVAMAYLRQAKQGARPEGEAARLARAAVHKALASDPAYGSAHGLLGSIALDFDADLGSAAQHLARALELAPGDALVLDRSGSLLDRLGRPDGARQLHELAVARDPVNAAVMYALALNRFYEGNLDGAITACQTVLSLSPGYAGAQYRIGMALLAKGDAEAALAAFELELSDEEFRVKGRALALHALGRQAEFETAFGELRQRWGEQWPSEIAQVYAWTGDADQAFAWLDRALAQNESGLTEQLRQSLYVPVHSDPRWQAFRERTGTSEAQLAVIPFDVKLPPM